MTVGSAADSAYVDLAFALTGEPLPHDHSLALWNALLRAAPALAEDDSLAVLPVRAASSGDGRLVLQRHSRLLLRLATSHVDGLLALCGTQIEIAGARVSLGDAKTRPLAHYATLYAHRVAAELGDDEQLSLGLDALEGGGRIAAPLLPGGHAGGGAAHDNARGERGLERGSEGAHEQHRHTHSLPCGRHPETALPQGLS